MRLLWLFVHIFLLIPYLQAQNFEGLKAIQEALDEDYDYYAKADPSNIGAKRLAGKIGILDQGITVLIQKKDLTTFEDVFALTEDLAQEAQKYQSAKAKNTYKLANKLLSELEKIGKELGFSSPKPTNHNNPPQPSPTENNTTQETPTPQQDTTNEKETQDTLQNEEVVEEQKPKKENIKIYEEPQPQSQDLSLIYAALALLFLMILVMWFSLNSAVKKIAQEMRARLKEHDREIEGLEKILLNSQMENSRLTNFKEEVEKRFESMEKTTTMLLMEADKRTSDIENEIKLLNKAKLDLIQFEALKKHLDNFVTKEHFDLALNSLQEKIKNTEASLKTASIISNVITSKLTHHFDEHKIQIIEALQEIKRKSNHPELKELIDSQLPLLHIAKILEDCNLIAIAKIVQLAFVAAYNESLSKPYEKLTQALRMESIDIEDNLTGRTALSEFNANNIPYEDYTTNSHFRTSDFPNFIAVKYEIENNPISSTAMPNTVLFTLHPTIYSSRQGSKQILKKGIYVIKK